MTKPKTPNGVGGWVLIALLCGGASGGATWLRPTPSHNPNITSTAWNEMCRDVDNLQRDLAELTFTVREVLRLVPPQPPHKQP